ncbi:hypothetical protein P8452_35122 [Trifolium repens]|nr:hypothetical protein P8452_35122 [Trifolium repens]
MPSSPPPYRHRRRLYPLYPSYSLVCAVFEQPWMLANEIFFSNRRLLRHVSRFFPSFSSHSLGLAPDWRERGKALGIAAFVSNNGWIRFRDRLFTVLELALEIRVLGCI